MNLTSPTYFSYALVGVAVCECGSLEKEMATTATIYQAAIRWSCATLPTLFHNNPENGVLLVHFRVGN